MADESPASAGCASLVGWAGAITFALGSAVLMLMLVAGNAGPFGIGAFYAGLVMTGGLLLSNAYASALIVNWDPRGHRALRILSAGALIVSLGLLAVFIAQFFDAESRAVDPLLTAAGAISLGVGAMLLPARAGQRGPGLLFGLSWLLLLAIVAVRA